MTKGTITTLTQEMLTKLYGDAPSETVRGFAYVEGGVPQIVFGMYRYDTTNVAFSRVAPSLRERMETVRGKRAVIAASRQMVDLIRTSPIPVRAIAEDGIEKSGPFLERLGFKHLTGTVYEWAPNV